MRSGNLSPCYATGKFSQQGILPCLCYHLKKRHGRFYLPDAVQIHFGVSQFKSLTVGVSARGFRVVSPGGGGVTEGDRGADRQTLTPDSMPYCEAGRNNMAIEYSLID